MRAISITTDQKIFVRAFIDVCTYVVWNTTTLGMIVNYYIGHDCERFWVDADLLLFWIEMFEFIHTTNLFTIEMQKSIFKQKEQSPTNSHI